MEIRLLESKEALNDIFYIKKLKHIHGDETPNDIVPVLENLTKYYQINKYDPDSYYETYVCETDTNKIHCAWITFHIESPVKKIRIYLFAIDKTIPPLLQGKASIAVSDFIVQYRLKNSDYNFMAFATPYSYRLYLKLTPDLVKNEFKLDNYFNNRIPTPAYLLYSPKS